MSRITHETNYTKRIHFYLGVYAFCIFTELSTFEDLGRCKFQHEKVSLHIFCPQFFLATPKNHFSNSANKTIKKHKRGVGVIFQENSPLFIFHTRHE